MLNMKIIYYRLSSTGLLNIYSSKTLGGLLFLVIKWLQLNNQNNYMPHTFFNLRKINKINKYGNYWPQ